MPLTTVSKDEKSLDKVDSPASKPSNGGIDAKGPLIGVGVCLYIVVVGYVAIQSIEALSFSSEVLPYLVATAGLLVFLFRQNFRLVYGLFETLFGVFICVIDFPEITTPPSSGVISLISGAMLAKQMAGLYVIVRGLDNIGKAVKKFSDPTLDHSWRKWRSKTKLSWDRWFGFD